MCNHAKCAFCGQPKLGLLMAWATKDAPENTGHVCYGCEDRVCNEIAAGRSNVRWLDTVTECR